MTETLQRKINDSFAVRWAALLLIALMMFFCYMFVDVLSPLQTMLETARGWTPETYGTVVGSEYFLNVFVLFLIFAGVILDKMGVRFTGLLSAGVMIVGAGIKLYGISDGFSAGGFGYDFFSSFWPAFPASAKVACIGFAIFGCGAEMAGVTVTKAIAKWFAGKEMAFAMGTQVAIARLGVAAVMLLSPRLAAMAPASVVRPVAVVGALLCIGFLTYLVFALMDRKLDRQLDAADEGPSEEFKVKDLGKLFSNPTFLMVAALCVLYYSAIFPFQKFAVPMLQNTLGISAQSAADIFAWFPIGAMVLTPVLGLYLDFKGKGATMLILGAILMGACHLTFALVPLTKAVAYVALILLGVSFSLVPAALWPSVPKLVEQRYLGSGYSVIFWIQNIGLWAFPVIIGAALQASNPGVTEQIQAGADVAYNYTVPMLIFASLGVLAFILGLWLKALDKKRGLGLELPNITK
ncbi:MAG: MFS transporter [Rikenellaceae bacterium]|jgi:predicted MFS family arabinose efflux permease|nr:MFS transporter [Rikenellaceae bacterium]